MPDLPEQTREDTARQWLARPVHELDEEAQADIFSETFRVLNHPDFAPLFSPDSLAEVSVSGVLGTDVVSARLDRLVVLDEDVLVVDYKTNRPAPTELSAVSEQYINQMRLYRQLLARIYPQKRIRCLLLWTDGPHILELPEALLSD